MAEIKMTALRTFRHGSPDQGFVWVREGQPYTVDTVDQKKFHVKTGRGRPVNSSKLKGD